jgi:hypothetical protein
VGSAHAGNHSPATFGLLFDHFVDNCETFGQAIVTGSAGGAPANGNHGLILFGSATMTGPNSPACIELLWTGSGSGTFSTNTLPWAWIDFILNSSNGTFQASDRKAALQAWRAKRRETPRNALPGAVGTYSCETIFPGFTSFTCSGPNCGGLRSPTTCR